MSLTMFQSTLFCFLLLTTSLQGQAVVDDDDDFSPFFKNQHTNKKKVEEMEIQPFDDDIVRRTHQNIKELRTKAMLQRKQQKQHQEQKFQVQRQRQLIEHSPRGGFGGDEDKPYYDSEDIPHILEEHEEENFFDSEDLPYIVAQQTAGLRHHHHHRSHHGSEKESKSKDSKKTKSSNKKESSTSSTSEKQKNSKRKKKGSEVSNYYKKSSLPYPCECIEQLQQEHQYYSHRSGDSEDVDDYYQETTQPCFCNQQEGNHEYTTYEFVMIQNEVLSEGGYGMSSSVGMNGLLFEMVYVDDPDGTQQRYWGDDPIGYYNSICTVVSYGGQELLCKFDLHFSSVVVSGPNGYASVIVSTPITKSSSQDVGVVTATAFDFGRYSRGTVTTFQDEYEPVLYAYLALG